MSGRYEAPAEAPKTDNVWRPKWLGEKGAWVCERQRVNADDAVEIETWGAKMRGPKGERFSAAHFPMQNVAQGICDGLNAQDCDGGGEAVTMGIDSRNQG